MFPILGATFFQGPFQWVKRRTGKKTLAPSSDKTHAGAITDSGFTAEAAPAREKKTLQKSVTSTAHHLNDHIASQI